MKTTSIYPYKQIHSSNSPDLIQNTPILNQNITLGINQKFPGQTTGTQAPQDDYFENENDQRLENLTTLPTK